MEVAIFHNLLFHKAFREVLESVIKNQFKDEDLRKGVTRQDVLYLVKSSDEFLEKAKVCGRYPWELEAGGRTSGASEVIFGTLVKSTDRLEEVTPETLDVSERSQKVLKMISSYDFSSGAMMGDIRTVGIHGFNALLNHDSLKPLLKGGPDKF